MAYPFTEKIIIIDTIHHSDSVSLMDLSAISGTIFMLFGSIYGFVLRWGPVWWGIIGLVFGFGLGLFIKFIILKKYMNRENSIKEPEAVLMIECKETLVGMVMDTLW